MKKAILILPILVLAILTLSGCNDTETKLIDTFTWQMTTIQNGKDGSAVACAPELAEIHEGAKPLRLTCKAKNGNLTITGFHPNYFLYGRIFTETGGIRGNNIQYFH